MPFSRGSSRPRDQTQINFLHCRQIFLPASHQGYESSIRKEDCSRRQETWKLFLVFVISWSMRLVKFFKGPRPQCSHLSHGQIRLGDL